MKNTIIFIFCIWALLPVLCGQSFQPGDYVYFVESSRQGGNVFTAEVIAGQSAPGKVRIASIRTRKIQRDVNRKQLKALSLGAGVTEFECQQELLAELFRSGIRAAKVKALKKLLESLYPGDERSRTILKLLESMDQQDFDQRKKFRELTHVLEEIKNYPESDHRHQLNIRAEALRDELADYGKDQDKLISDAVNRQDFWIAVTFAEQLNKQLLQMLRSRGSALQNTDQKDLYDSVQDRETEIVNALKKSHQWRAADRSAAAKILPSSSAWWNRPAPRDAMELQARMAAAVKAWHDLAELSMLAEPEQWCDAAMEVLSLLPRHNSGKELRDPLKRQLEALAAETAGPTQEKQKNE